MDKKVLIIASAAAIIIALAASYVYLSDDSDGDRTTVVEMDVVCEDDEKTLVLTASADKFNENAAANSILVYFFALDGYIDDTGNFDYTTFYNDMEAQGAYDEDIGDYLPANAEKITDFTLSVKSSTEMDVEFTKAGTYAAYIVVLDLGAVSDQQPLAVSLYDIPEETYTNMTPRVSVENEVYENIDDYIFTVKAVNTEFSSGITTDSVELTGAFSDLTLISVDYIDSETIEVTTNGYVTRGTSSVGYIDLAEDATTCGYELTATVSILSNAFSIDESSFELNNGVLSFDLTVSRNVYDNYDRLVLSYKEYLFTDYVKTVTDDAVVLHMSLTLSETCIDDCVADLNGKSLIFTGGVDVDAAEYSLCLPGTVLSAYVDKTVSSGSTLTATVPIYAYSGSIDGLTSGDVRFVSDYDSAVSIAYSEEYGTYCATIVISGFDGEYLSGSLVLDDGVSTPWGTDSDAVSIPLSASLGSGSSVSTDEMINAIYKNMNFNKIMGKINIATAGIGAVVDILGATGVIDMRSATDIAVAEINLKCDEIKNMLADQSLQLEKMSKKLDEIKGMLKEQRYLELSKIYHEFLAANNKLANDISTLSSDIKSDVWKLIKDESDNTFYIYVTEDGKLSIMQGDFYTELTHGQTVDGKNILTDYTIGISLDNGDTFANANKGTAFSKDTEGRMVDCLKAYLIENDIVDSNQKYVIATASGDVTYTADELAQKIYDCIVVKFTELRAVGDDGKNILTDYRAYTEMMASLVVSPSGDVSISSDLRSNPIIASQELMQSNYNFETEAHEYLKSLNDSTTMFLVSYTTIASGIEQLQGGNGTTVEKHFDATMKFLSGHRGYVLDSSVMHDYCYVTNSFLKAKEVTISVKATFHTTDDFRHNVSDKPTDITPIKTQQQLGIPSKYLNTDQLKKLQENYNRLKSQGVTNLSIDKYLQNHTGCMFTGYISNDLITSFDGGENYNDGRHVKLYSNCNLVSPGHSAQLVDSGSMYEISGTIDKSGCFKQFKAYSSNVYGKIAYKGDLYNVKTGQFYDKVCNVHGFIYAVGFFSKHVHAWTNDEAAVLTPEKSLSNCTVGVESKSFNHRTYFVDAKYMVIQLT